MTRHEASSTLPAPSAQQLRHSTAVIEAVRAAIHAQGGWLGFEQYLRIVLYAPGLGYYAAGSVKFGHSGDFVTAPEISGLYARCVASQCAQVLRVVGGDVLELGAGSGRLAAGVLEALAELGPIPERYRILEVSADLRARQQARLAELPAALAGRVVWLDTMPSAPIAGVVLANEVADALPFQRFVVEGANLYERGVALSATGELVESDRSAGAELRAELARIVPGAWPEQYLSELCTLADPWIAAIGAALARGAAFIIDYGLPRHEYYHPQRDQGTMRCHYRHRVHEDALRYPGLQDITAWVDFTRVAEAAVAAGLTVAGYCTQAAFLLGNGIERELAAVPGALERARLAAEARVLLQPGEMGEYVKVMALTRDFDEPLRGFQHQDLRRSL
ncbi:MAG: SAM-dependent methyltransferase [Steroidobacteraceae bacterium]